MRLGSAIESKQQFDHLLHLRLLRAPKPHDGSLDLRRGDGAAGFRARQQSPGITISVCGEHGGNPESIAFCHEAGFDYVSCSPFRVPVARLAAAQSALRARHRIEEN